MTSSYRVWKKLYLGLGYLYADIDTRLRLDIPDQPFFDPTLRLNMAETFKFRDRWILTGFAGLVEVAAFWPIYEQYPG